MGKPRVFISFDYDHDSNLKDLLVGQSKHPDTPFELADWSIKEPQTGDWKEKARKRIKVVDQMIVLCGQHTDTATGVSAEIRLAREESKPYFLLKGYRDATCKWPVAASTDKMYNWTWDNLKALIAGSR
jgi:hypothetical protein